MGNQTRARLDKPAQQAQNRGQIAHFCDAETWNIPRIAIIAAVIVAQQKVV